MYCHNYQRKLKDILKLTQEKKSDYLNTSNIIYINKNQSKCISAGRRLKFVFKKSLRVSVQLNQYKSVMRNTAACIKRQTLPNKKKTQNSNFKSDIKFKT